MNENPMGADGSDERDEVGQLIEQAQQAQSAGNESLALHLYLAAFEQLSTRAGNNRPVGGERPLRAAWDLAVRSSDRRGAEAVLEKLMPYLTPAEAAGHAGILAQMAAQDLSNLGIDPSNMPDLSELANLDLEGLEDLVDQLPPEITNLFDVEGLLGQSGGFKVKMDDEGPITSDAVGAGSANPGDETKALPADDKADDSDLVPLDPALPVSPVPPVNPMNPMGSPQDFLNSMLSALGGGGVSFANQNMPQQAAETMPAPHFSDVPGFNDVKRELQALGIGINPDSELGKQAQADLLFHGIDGFTSLPSVIIRVPEGTDLTKLIHAAAGEMDVPFAQLSVSVAPGSRRRDNPEVSVRMRGDFAPMRPGSMPAKGILFIDCADEWPEGLAANTRRLGDYVSTMAAQPGVAVVLTCSQDEMPPRDLLQRLGDEVHVIVALAPQVTERYDAWARIAEVHPSAKGIDVGLLAMVTDGMLTDTFELAVRDAATDAWRLGLSEGRRQEVSTIDVLGKLADYAPNEDVYNRIMAVIDEQWSAQLDRMEQELSNEGGEDAQ